MLVLTALSSRKKNDRFEFFFSISFKSKINARKNKGYSNFETLKRCSLYIKFTIEQANVKAEVSLFYDRLKNEKYYSI